MAHAGLKLIFSYPLKKKQLIHYRVTVFHFIFASEAKEPKVRKISIFHLRIPPLDSSDTYEFFQFKILLYLYTSKSLDSNQILTSSWLQLVFF